MKNILATALIILIPLAARANSIEKELEKWKNIMPLISQTCANGKRPENTKPYEAVKITECVTSLLEREIYNDVVYKDLIITMRQNAFENATAYQNNKISNQEYVHRGHQEWQLYLKALEKRSQNSEFYGEKQ